MGKNKNPLVYIVLPVYNGEKFFLEQLMSIYYQDYSNWYLIIVNDGSTDKSELIVRDFISHYSLYDKVKIINKENGGLNSAIARGLEEIRIICDIHGTDSLVAYCDCDDIWTREKLSIQVNFMLNNPQYGLVYHDLAIIDEGGILIKQSNLKNYWHNQSFIYVSTVGGNYTATEMMFRACYIDKILPMPLGRGMAQDYWTGLVFSLLELGIGFVDRPLVYLRRGHSSLSVKNAKDLLINRQEYYKFLQERFPEKNLSYIIKCNQDWMVNWRKNGTNIPYIVFRIMLKYPKVFRVCVRMFFHRITCFFR